MSSPVRDWLKQEGFPLANFGSKPDAVMVEEYLDRFREFCFNRRGQDYHTADIEEYRANPMQWQERWLDLSGDIKQSRPEPGRYQVELFYEDIAGKGVPLSTGVGESLDRAFQLAILGLETVASFMPKQEKKDG